MNGGCYAKYTRDWSDSSLFLQPIKINRGKHVRKNNILFIQFHD